MVAARTQASTDAWWLRQIEAHNAVALAKLADGRDHPDRAIAFETRNFGFIYSAKDANGVRHLLLKY